VPFSGKTISDETKERVNMILDAIISYARLEFNQKLPVKGDGDVLDAICAGVNMLGEEIESSTVSLKVKEQLLKEIHHRVKNNLQIVSSLLKLQSENVFDEKYLALIKDSRNRINSMALVHEMLYSSSDLGKINVSEYVRRLCESVLQASGRPGSEIDFQFILDRDLHFEIDMMIPLGLIINEALSNSLKFAFPENKGTVSISLKKEEEKFALKICDNGVGFPANFDFAKDANLGMQLIYMLSEQMDGNVQADHDKGASYHIVF
jgi:two-component sensor histidine kinase